MTGIINTNHRKYICLTDRLNQFVFVKRLFLCGYMKSYSTYPLCTAFRMPSNITDITFDMRQGCEKCRVLFIFFDVGSFVHTTWTFTLHWDRFTFANQSSVRIYWEVSDVFVHRWVVILFLHENFFQSPNVVKLWLWIFILELLYLL